MFKTKLNLKDNFYTRTFDRIHQSVNGLPKNTFLFHLTKEVYLRVENTYTPKHDPNTVLGYTLQVMGPGAYVDRHNNKTEWIRYSETRILDTCRLVEGKELESVKVFYANEGYMDISTK